MMREQIKGVLSLCLAQRMIYTAGPVLRSGAGSLADGKPWVSMPLSQNEFTMPTHISFLEFKLSTNVPLMVLISWLLTLMHEAHSESWLIIRVWLYNTQ